MSAERNEQPTQQKLQKSREKGQFPSAKELVGALQFFVIVLIVSRNAPGWFESSQTGFREFLMQAFRPDWTTPDLIAYTRRLLIACFVPLGASAGIVVGLTLAFQMGATNMGLTLSKLAPDLSRLSPMGRLKDIGKQNIPHAIQAILLILVLGWVMNSVVGEHLPMLMLLPLESVPMGLARIGDAVSSVLWRATFILVVFGVVEGMRQRAQYHSMQKMTKQEIREEAKESDGDPYIKARIRRLRRDLLRNQMMKDVPTATAVVVNPTHYAIAIRYEPNTMAAPKVVAKGRNFVAARIRQLATENGVMIVENPPLARALYGSVEVGQDVPPDFYRAVAEVLAYVYKAAGHRSLPS